MRGVSKGERVRWEDTKKKLEKESELNNPEFKNMDSLLIQLERNMRKVEEGMNRGPFKSAKKSE